MSKFQPFSFLNKSGTWPTGAGGNLTISTAVTIAPGTVWDYENITITNTGSLTIQPGSAPVIIGCRNVFTNNGSIIGRQGGIHNGGTFNVVAPDGYNYSYLIAQSSGGAGGNCAITSGGGSGLGSTGGPGTNGYGGGGAGGSWNDPPGLTPSTGGSNNGNGFTGVQAANTGGLGGNTGGNGLNGEDWTTAVAYLSYVSRGGNGGGSGGGGASNRKLSSSPTVVQIGGGGGGGGMKGVHGQGLYLRCGTFTGNGTFDFRGTAGFNGGRGANRSGGTITGAVTVNAYKPGGGGGGGAGGSGGNVIVRCGTNSFAGTFSMTGGTGGTAGIAGTGGVVGTQNGNNGVAGGNGSSSIIVV